MSTEKTNIPSKIERWIPTFVGMGPLVFSWFVVLASKPEWAITPKIPVRGLLRKERRSSQRQILFSSFVVLAASQHGGFLRKTRDLRTR